MPDTENNVVNTEDSIDEFGPIELEMTVNAAETVQAPIDDTLSIAGEAADAKATGDAIADVNADLANAVADIGALETALETETADRTAGDNLKVNKPTTSPDGSQGQLLMSNGDGSTNWSNVGTPSDQQVGTAVSTWLMEHPEATTTVQDGAISRAKLDADLKAKTDDVSSLKSAIDYDTHADESLTGKIYFELENGGITDGENKDSDSQKNYYGRCKGFIPVTAGEVICHTNANSSSDNFTYYCYDSNKDYENPPGAETGTDAFTVPTGVYYLRFKCVIPGNDGDLTKLKGFCLYRKNSKLNDEIEDIKDEISDIKLDDANMISETGSIYLKWENGGISNSTGDEQSSSASYLNTYGRTVNYIPVTPGEYLIHDHINPEGYAITFQGYNSSKVWQHAYTGYNKWQVPDGISYIRLKYTFPVNNGDLGQITGFSLYRQNGAIPRSVADLQMGYFHNPLYDPAGVRQTAWRGCCYVKIGSNNYYTLYAPDNSWPAYHRAVEERFDMLWLAVVRFSSDGTPYVHHDATLSNGDDFDAHDDEYYEDDYTLDDTGISSDAKALWDTDDLHVPKFEDVVKYCLLNKMRIGIRCGALPSSSSDARWTAVKEIIDQYGIASEVVFSGSPSRCNAARSLFPYANVQIDCTSDSSTTATTPERAMELIEEAETYGGNASVNLYLNSAVTTAVMEAARAAKVRVYAVCQEVPSTEHLETDIPLIKDACPDYLITKAMINFRN